MIKLNWFKLLIFLINIQILPNNRLFKAIENNNIDSIRGLLKADMHRLYKLNADYYTPLMWAAKCNASNEICEILINGNSHTINIKHKQTGYTALMFVISGKITNHSYHLVKLLLENGADPKIKNFENQTAFDILMLKNLDTLEFKEIKNLLENWINRNMYIKLFVKNKINQEEKQIEDSSPACVVQ